VIRVNAVPTAAAGTRQDAGREGQEAPAVPAATATAAACCSGRTRSLIIFIPTSASPGAIGLADGFSCRTQIHELDSGGRDAMHLAELLATAGNLGYDRPERAAAPRPVPAATAAKAAAVLGTAAAALTAAAAGALLRRRLTRRTQA
jgi:hypothetical protein